MKSELAKLKPKNTQEDLATLGVTAITIAVYYAVYREPYLAFAFFPIVGLSSYASNRGVGFSTPRLYAAQMLVSALYISVALTVITKYAPYESAHHNGRDQVSAHS
jgi:hypothetical protein